MTRGLACGGDAILREAIARRSRRAVDMAREAATRMAPKLALQLQGLYILVCASLTYSSVSLSLCRVGRAGACGGVTVRGNRRARGSERAGGHWGLEMPRCLHNMKPAIYLHGND